MDEYRTIAAHPTPWRARIYHVIFGTDTWPGKLFDIALLVAILASVLAVSLETVESLSEWHDELLVAEIVFTVLFTIEYILRLICVRRPIRYARSFFGVIDLMSFLPTYVDLLATALVWPVTGTKLLVVLRTMRLLRLFRIFELSRFMREAESLSRAIWDARARVAVFLLTVLIAVTIAGTAMYLIEHERPNSQFTSIPQSMYWAVVTMTTVGYGDVVPHTAAGKVLSAVLILLGYSLIIVPTGFVSAELISGVRQAASRECPHCAARGHQEDARFCRQCAGELP